MMLQFTEKTRNVVERGVSHGGRVEKYHRHEADVSIQKAQESLVADFVSSTKSYAEHIQVAHCFAWTC